ncbi:unnamed protein product [Microthlaspi erraticum]|uniref:Uncharacterized protein n=1 Tax=Microthlaspi erraticum TaxID=1685480 RepID=A0A6D2KHW9_9BRAS|nr:unnamed protein product [Microthlaspi erraticum]
MKGEKKISLGARKKKLKTKNSKLVRSSIVAYLKSDDYFFAPLLSTSPSLEPQIQTDDLSLAADALGNESVIKKKGRMSEKVKEYLKSDCHMYGPMISPPTLASSLKDYQDRFCIGPKIVDLKAGKVQIKNVVTMELSTSSTAMKEDTNNCMNLRSDIAEKTLHNARINSPKRPLVILEGQRNGLSRERAFSSQPEEEMVKPDQRRVTIESKIM